MIYTEGTSRGIDVIRKRSPSFERSQCSLVLDLVRWRKGESYTPTKFTIAFFFIIICFWARANSSASSL